MLKNNPVPRGFDAAKMLIQWSYSHVENAERGSFGISATFGIAQNGPKNKHYTHVINQPQQREHFSR